MAAPGRRIGEWQLSWRCLVHSARQGFATTASTLTGPVFEYRRHQSCSATAGPLDGHQEPAIAPKADVELSPLLLAGEGVEGYRHDKRSPATMK
jgi:hypothetical protein